MKKNLSKRVALLLMALCLSIPSAFAYIQCAISCGGRIVHIFVDDDLSEEDQIKYIADKLEEICDEEEGRIPGDGPDHGEEY